MKDDKHEDFLRLYTESLGSLRRFVLAYVPDYHAAQDILQEAALTLWDKFDMYERERPFLPWAFGVVRNEILRHRRAVAQNRVILTGDLPEKFEEKLASISEELDERRAFLDRCVDRLPDRSRKALEMYYRSSMSTDVIATFIGSTANAVRILLTRARRAIAECLEKMTGRNLSAKKAQ